MLITKQQWSLVLLFLLWSSSGSEAYLLDPGEANVLKQISKELSEKGWDFNVDPCSGNEAWNTSKLINGYNNTILCNYCNNGACHVTHLFLKAQSLSGFLPPSLAKLPYLQMGDFSRNCLRGTIPKEWTSLRNLSFLSVSMNNLSGPIPDYLGDLTSLEYLSIESNLFSGRIPAQLGNLVNLVNLILNANNLTGSLPPALSKLTNLSELRISSNNFEGKLPDLHHWPNLVKLEIQGSGLEGPIPPSISVLKNITELRISDLSGHQGSKFPVLENLTALQRLMLRSCNISGQIPPYLNRMEKLQILDLSFNRLQGNIPDLQNLEKLERMELISNFLSGDLPSWVNEKNRKFNADVSYNNFNESSIFDTCIDTVNLYRSFHSKNGTSVAKCLDPCGEEQYSFYVNCGGKETTIDGNKYEADEDGRDASKFVTPSRSRTWGTSTSGDFWDVSSGLQHIFRAKSTSNLDMRNSELYTTARLSPLSLTYFARCLKNGNYTVILHFAEIVIRGDISYYSLGRRIFDVYVQEKLVLKDFNIAEEAKGVDKVHNETFENVIVRNKILEIRFHWSGKGTASVPIRGNYGPLISAISVNSEFKPHRRKQNRLSDKTKIVVAVGVGLSVVFLTLF